MLDRETREYIRFERSRILRETVRYVDSEKGMHGQNLNTPSLGELPMMQHSKRTFGNDHLLGEYN